MATEPQIRVICEIRGYISCLFVANNLLLTSDSCLLSSNFVPIRHLYICREPSTNSPLFMQNKPNFLNARMNVTSVAIKSYSENDVLAPPKNKPNQTQFKAKTKPIGWTLKMNVTSFTTSDYTKKRSFSPKKTNPIQTQTNPISNFLPKAITLEITKTLSGEVKSSQPEAKIEKLARGLRRVNTTAKLTWTIELKTDEHKEIGYSYDVYVRR